MESFRESFWRRFLLFASVLKHAWLTIDIVPQFSWVLGAVENPSYN
jgi:hypothetical protein